jgi:hypothetical protein
MNVHKGDYKTAYILRVYLEPVHRRVFCTISNIRLLLVTVRIIGANLTKLQAIIIISPQRKISILNVDLRARG